MVVDSWFDGWRVHAWNVENGHGQFGPLFRKQWICLGYRIKVFGKVLAISGDTVSCAGGSVLISAFEA